MVNPGDYGMVKVTKGRHKGKIGLYDDDSESGTKGIVYFSGNVLYTGSWVGDAKNSYKDTVVVEIPYKSMDSIVGKP